MTESVSPLDVSILVPVYNEAGNIRALADEIAAVLGPTLRYEIVFIDDGSSDGSAAELDAVRGDAPHIRVLRHSRRSGKSAALKSGARAARGPWLQTLDGDGQDDPKDVIAALKLATAPDAPKNLGLVAGQRQRRNDGILKTVASRFANRLRRAMLKDGTPDTGCGFKLIRAEAFADVPFFDGMHRFLPALVRRAGWEVAQLPVNNRPRGAGKSKYGIFDRMIAGAFDLWGVGWLNRRARFARERTGDL